MNVLQHQRSGLASGFTLIEVLVAMLLLTMGLLGLAALQVSSLNFNQSAYNRSVATELANDLADRMRANVSGVAAYTATAPTVAKTIVNCKNSIGCSPANMAENDLYEWNQVVTNALTNGVGQITVANSIFTISISWLDDRNGNSTNFQTSFRL